MKRHHPNDNDAKLLHTEREILHVEEAILRREDEILRDERETHREVEEIERRLCHPQITFGIAIKFSGASTMNTLVLNIGQSSIASIVPFLADGTTPSGGTVSGVTFSISDPSLTITDNGDGTSTITGIAASSAPVNGTASATVTDTDSAVATFTQSFTVTVNAPVPPTQLTQSIGVSFSTPTP